MKVSDEAIAITTRVAPSFIRIGHLDLHSRRCQTHTAAARAYKGTSDEAKTALKQLVRECIMSPGVSQTDHFWTQVEHTIAREFPHINAKVS